MRRITTAAAILCCGWGNAAPAQSAAPARCGTGIPADEAIGFVPLPRGDVFCSLVADPKELGSFASYLRGNSEKLDTDIGSVGIGDRWGILRWGGPRHDDGVQLSLVGSVFAQFDLRAKSFDLINADYLVALPLTLRRGGASSRLRVYHQSSHLGDEFLLRSRLPERENLSFEAVDWLLSGEVGPARLYAGGEYVFRRDPETLDQHVAHAGAEFRPRGIFFGVRRLASVRLIAAVDVKATKEQEWTPAWSVRGGVEVGRPREGGAVGRRWRLLGEYYTGPSPYGQFFVDDVSYYGIGMHFTL